MARYTSLYSDIWNDDNFLEVSQCGKLLALYFRSCDSNNILGYYAVSKKEIGFRMDLSAQEVEQCIEELVDREIICFDKKEGIVLILDYLRTNKVVSTPQISSAKKQLDILPLTSLHVIFFRQLVHYAPDIISKMPEKFKRYVKFNYEGIADTGDGMFGLVQGYLKDIE